MPGNSILAKLAIEISAQTAGFKQSLDKTNADLNKFTGGLKRIGGAIIAAFGAQQVASFAFEISKLAGEAEGVRNAFNRLPDSIALMEKLKMATGGTVSELELMKRSVQATNFGIELQALPQLLEFAAVRAQQTGESVDYLVNSIVIGIGRKSPLILDNLGISAAALKDELGGVSVAAADVGTVSEAVGKIAARELEKMGGLTENVGTQTQQLSANYENLKVALGNAANGTGLLGQALNLLNKALIGLGKGIDRISGQDVIQQRVKDAQAFARSAVTDIIKVGGVLEQETQKIGDATKAQTDILAALSNNVKKARAELTLLTGNENRFSDALSAVTSKSNGLSTTFERNRKPLEDLNKELGTSIKSTSDYDGAVSRAEQNVANLEATLRALQAEFNGNSESISENIGLVAALENRISELKDEIKEAPNIPLLRKLQQELEITEVKLKNLLEPLKDFSGVDLSKLDDKLGGFDDKSIIGELFKGFDTEIDNVAGKLEAGQERLDITFARMRNAARGAQVEIGQALQDLKASATVAFAELLGESLVEPKDFGKGILKAAAGFAQQFGAFLVSAGFAAKAAQQLAINPNAAIVAGAALVAIGAAAKKALSKETQKAFGGGGGSTSSRASTQSFTPNTGTAQNSTQATFKIQGQDLWVTLKNFERNNNFTSAIGG